MAINFILIAPWALALIFLLLALLHIYWAADGAWGRDSVIPTKEDGSLMFAIGPYSCLVVAGVLLCLCGFYLAYWISFLGMIKGYSQPAFIRYGTFIIALGFVLRATGDFKYVGFFKSVRNTKFGRLDTKYFSPLCLAIGLASLFLFLLSNN